MGNRETRTVGGALETLHYDPASNRLASVLAGGVTRAFTYSASGNVILDDAGGSATTLTYNALDRLVQVGSGGIALVDYVYAATGQRAVKATPLATTHYLYDPGGALYAETDGAGTVLREYITLGGATIAIVNATGINYVHYGPPGDAPGDDRRVGRNGLGRQLPPLRRGHDRGRRRQRPALPRPDRRPRDRLQRQLAPDLRREPRALSAKRPDRA